MAKFRAKASKSIIDAWQWNFSENQSEPPVWVDDALIHWPATNSIAFWPDGNFKEDDKWSTTPHIAIKVGLPGMPEIQAFPTDYIIRRSDGTIWRASADRFEAFYEPYDEPQKPVAETESAE